MSNADRIRAKFALAHGKAAVEHDCPPLESVLAWHEKTLDAGKATAIQTHVAQCEHCFALWSGLVALAPAEAEVPVAAPRRRWWQFGVPALALGAVAISFWIGIFNQPALPAYSMEIRGGLEMRGGDTTPALILRDDTLLRVVVAPARAVDESMAAVAFAKSSATLTPLPVTMTVSDKGVASLEAVVGSDLRVGTGVERLVFVVGREGKLPSEAVLMQALGDQFEVARADWQAFSVELSDTP
ncbi:MAG: hypothetical protein AB8G16_08135 [Gammaproteobacteria bacterium]